MRDGLAIEINTRFEVIYCYECKIPFAVPAVIRADWQQNGENFYCPNGHIQHYTESDVQRLNKKLKREQEQLELERKRTQWAQQAARNAENRRRAEKAAKTRIKNRVAKGVCPCCNRSFPNLHRHMETKHPDYTETP